MDGSDVVTPDASIEVLRSRVTLGLEPGGMSVDGVWWPRSDSLVRELPALDVAIAAALDAAIARFSYVLGGWSDRPRRVRADGHLIKIGWFSHGAIPDTVELSLSDYRRVVLRVLAPDTPPGEAEAVMNSATVLTSWPRRRPSGAPVSIAGRAHGEDPQGAGLPTPDPGAPDPVRPEVPAVRALLDGLALIEDPSERESAARQLEWRATEWALAAGRIRWGAHAEALESAGEPPSPSSPPWV